MRKNILINAKYPEEKRVAIVEGDRLVDFYVEISTKEHLRGNIYKGLVASVEPALQAVFVDFGTKKHGFLQMHEIMPKYFGEAAKEKKKRLQDIFSAGQELIVQVERDERDTKGASLTTYLSLPGRYIVMIPGQERVGISRKIEDKEERARLKEIFRTLKLPQKMGFIVRTAGIDKTAEDLSNDLKYLIKLWDRIQREVKRAEAPELIYKEQDFAVRTVRDYLSSDVDEVLVDDQKAYRDIKIFLRQTLPWRKINIKYYREKSPVFELHAIEDQIAKINDRYVYLPSKGYLVFDRTEAMTTIDVNSGRSRKERNIEQTALRTNLEAADEIARQLRLRDIGGLIVIDFIDMEIPKNQREVEERLKAALSPDKAHTDVSEISRFGILEMTRERVRTAYFESAYRKCQTCEGSGVVKTDELLALSALRDIHMKIAKRGIKLITCRLPISSANRLINTNRDELAVMEKEFRVKINILSDPHVLPGQYVIDVEPENHSENNEGSPQGMHKR
jgi:ribonuclease E